MDSQEERPIFYTVKIKAVRAAGEVERSDESSLICKDCTIDKIDSLSILLKDIRGVVEKSDVRIGSPSRCLYTSDSWSSVSACHGNFLSISQNASGSEWALVDTRARWKRCAYRQP